MSFSFLRGRSASVLIARFWLGLILLSSTHVFAVGFISLSVGTQTGSVTYPGGSVTYTVTGTTTGVGNNTTTCSPLATSGLPTGVTSSFNPTDLSYKGTGTTTSLLTLTVSGSAVPISNAAFSVTCTDGNTLTANGSFTQDKGSQTVSFTSTAPSATVGGATYTPTATTTSGLTVALTIDASSSSVCSISGGVVSFQAVGACKIDANQGGNGNYNVATQVQQTVTVAKGNQTISFTSTAPSATVGGATYTPTATTTSGLTVALTIDASSSSVCSISGGVVSFQAVGACKIDANQGGNGNYNVATQVQQAVTVSGKANQTISFTSTAPSATVGGASYTPTATVTSGLAVVLTIDASSSGVCSISGGLVSFLAAGTCTIDANQVGNSSYNAAPQVQQAVTVTKNSQIITFGGAPTVVVGGTGTVTATGGASGNPVTFTSTTTGVCTVSGTNGSTVTGVTTGTCSIAADQAGNANYNAAIQVTQSFSVGAAMPTVTTNPATNTVPVNSWAKMLNGTVSANGAATMVYFEYGLTTLYGDSITTDQPPLLAGDSGVAVTQELAGLNCRSTFHYRVVAVNSAGLVNGADQSFTTGSCIPPFPASVCAAQRFGQNLGCTANDVGLTNIGVATTSPAQPTSCISGTPVTLDLDMTVNFGAAKRYDIGIFVANDGKSPTALPTSGGASTCNVAVLPITGTQAFPNLDGAGTGDTCGDGSAGLSKVYTMTGVTIPCYASPTSGGKLYVPYTVSWDNQASLIGSLCTSNLYPVPNTTSKCNAPGGTVWIDVVVLPKINKTHSGATFNPGDPITYSIVVFNDSGGTLQQSTLTDPAVPVGGGTPGPGTPGLVVSNIGCVAANGATCPTATIATGGHGINPVTIPSLNLPNNSSLTFTITGNLYGAKGETIDNTATITIGTNSKTSTDSVTLGAAAGGMSFAPSSITEGNNSVLTITFTNPTASPVAGVGFTDTYPSGLVNAASPNASTTCTGGTATATAGGTTLAFSGGTVPALGSCTVSVTVTSATANSYVNSVTFSGISGSTSATLSVTTAVFGSFNACNSAAAPNVGCTATSTPYTSRLGTKLAGTAFNLDVVALNPNTSRNTSYANTVVVELLDASNNTGLLDAYGCRSTWTNVIGTLSSNPVFVSGNTGLKTVGSFTVNNAYKDVRVRITQSGSTTIKGCSTDDFAIRPTGFTLSSTNANADSSGSSVTNTPKIKAGASFSLTATAVAVATTTAAYVGTPLINGSGITAHTGAVHTGNLTGTFGAATSGIASGSAFIYSEVGYLGFNPDAIYDGTFTAMDLPSDCTNDFSNTAVNGLFGCKFGNTTTTYFGRFIPDHFDTAVMQVAGVPMACPTGLTCPNPYNGIVYSGQPFSLNVTAMNALGNKTQNYQGAFAKAVTLSAAASKGGAVIATGGTGEPKFPVNTVANTTFTGGSNESALASPVFTFAASPTVPTDVYVRAIETAPDGDGVSSLRVTVPATPSVEGGVKVVSGRLKIPNMYGSERLPLPLPVTVQYYNGSYWVTSLTDSVTSFDSRLISDSGNLVADNSKNASNATCAAVSTPDLAPVSSGVRTLSLSRVAPPAPKCITFFSLNAPSYLNVDPSIRGSATFGIYKSRLIYRRENY